MPNEPVAARTFHKSGAENEIEPVGAYPGRGWGETGGGPVPTRVSRFKTQTGRTRALAGLVDDIPHKPVFALHLQISLHTVSLGKSLRPVTSALNRLCKLVPTKDSSKSISGRPLRGLPLRGRSDDSGSSSRLQRGKVDDIHLSVSIYTDTESS